MNSSKAAKVAVVGLLAIGGALVVRQWPKAGGIAGIAVMAMLNEALKEPVALYLHQALRPA